MVWKKEEEEKDERKFGMRFKTILLFEGEEGQAFEI